MAGRGYQDYIETPDASFGGGFGSLGVDWGAYVAPGNPFTVGQLYNPVPEPERFVPPSANLSPILLPAATAAAVASLPPIAGDSAVSESPVIDPTVDATRTVYEDAPGGIYETNRPETDWDWVYSQYVILNPPSEPPGSYRAPRTIPKPELPQPVIAAPPLPPVVVAPAVVPEVISVPTIDPEDGEMAIDWGSAAGSFVGGILDPFGFGKATTNFFGQPGPINGGTPSVSTPPKVTVDTRTGQVTVCRRRRRRRLLTSSDLADIAALKAIIGGGAALNSAVVKAVRR